VDPFFSSGVHIAMTGAMSAAATICASIKGQIDEVGAQAWHDAKVGVAHTRCVTNFTCAQSHQQIYAGSCLLCSVPISRCTFNPFLFSAMSTLITSILHLICLDQVMKLPQSTVTRLTIFSSDFRSGRQPTQTHRQESPGRHGDLPALLRSQC